MTENKQEDKNRILITVKRSHGCIHALVAVTFLSFLFFKSLLIGSSEFLGDLNEEKEMA